MPKLTLEEIAALEQEYGSDPGASPISGGMGDLSREDRADAPSLGMGDLTREDRGDAAVDVVPVTPVRAPASAPVKSAAVPATPAKEVSDYIGKKFHADEELKRLQGGASDKRFVADLLAGAAQIGAGAMGATNFDPHGFDQLRASADQGVNDYQKKREDERKQVEQSTAEQKFNREAALEDPKSVQSTVARNVAQRELKKYGANPRMVDGMSAADVKEFMDKTLGRMDAAASREQIAKLAAQTRMDTRGKDRQDRFDREAKVNDKQGDEIADFDKSVASVNQSLASMKNNYVGPLDGRVPDMLVSGDESAFRANVGRMTDAYRKLITGAGASNQELARLESRLPQVTDTPENFRAKAQGFIQEVQRNRGVYLDNLKKRGKNVAPYESGVSAPPAGPQPPPHGAKVRQAGHTFTWNASTGKYE